MDMVVTSNGSFTIVDSFTCARSEVIPLLSPQVDWLDQYLEMCCLAIWAWKLGERLMKHYRGPEGKPPDVFWMEIKVDEISKLTDNRGDCKVL